MMICIIVSLKLDFISNLSNHVHLNLLLEVEVSHSTLTTIQRGVISKVRGNTKDQFSRSTRSDVNFTPSEDSSKVSCLRYK